MAVDDPMAEWRRLKAVTTRDGFTARFAHPFLVRRRPARAASVPPDDFGERLAFETKVQDLPVTAPAAAGRLAGARVFPVAKVAGNPFPDRISVGRAQNCDIVLRDASVSKLHAHFCVLGPGSAELTDVRSANRTKVNATLLEPGVATRVGSGDTLIFGAIAVQLLDPRALYDLL